VLSVPANLGYGALFALVLAESAGVPVPGETALLAAGALAGAGKLSLPIVIGVAAIASIIGDNLGYWLGRRGGRRVFASRGPFARHRLKLLERGERFFASHGAKTVFVARWITGVRVVAAVVAGASAMPWRTFLVFNVAGAITWASVTASIAAALGPVGVGVLYGIGLALGGLITLVGASRSRRRDDAEPPPTRMTADVQPDEA
jgi:membrane protein DedA with SNARE-associated domain